MDRCVEAKQAFIDVLLNAPTNSKALIEFGNFLTSIGSIAAACRVYTELLKHQPDHAVARVNLANLLMRAGEIESAQRHYEAALKADPALPQAHQGLGTVLAAKGDRAAADMHFRTGFAGHSMVALPYRGEEPPVELLQLVSSGDGNIPTGPLVDDRIFGTTVVVTDFHDRSTPLPPHRLVFNAIGDADVCVPALTAAIDLIKGLDAPVINRPLAVLKTGRAGNSERLGALRHVRAPITAKLPRAALTGPDAKSVLSAYGLAFPLLVRSIGFHTGRNFSIVEAEADLPAALADLPGQELLAIEYLDARGADGKYRKYRAMFVDGRIFPLHAAISRNWKVHYFTADMANDPGHRREDAAFLTDMRAVIGHKAMSALAGVGATLGLDYGGIDFGIGTAGEVLLFEANATMVVNPPDADERWAYRHGAVTRILGAVKDMLLRTASRPDIRKVG